MFFSTIIPTIGRSSLSKAVYSVLDQNFEPNEFEVIVVNDSGKELPKADWQNSERVKVINTNRRERCFARNVGAAVSKGTYLHFLDDDDWILPDAFAKIHEAAEITHAGLIYGGCRLIDKDGNHLLDHNIGVDGNCFINVMAGEWIPLTVSFYRAEMFFKLGGFDPMFNICEDYDLSRRFLSRSVLTNISDVIGCSIRDRSNTTTDYSQHLKNSIMSRNKIMEERGVFVRLRKSAGTSYWKGRLVRAYLTCVIWNLKNKKVHVALSRAFFAFAGLITSGSAIFTYDYWRGLLRSHYRKGLI